MFGRNSKGGGLLFFIREDIPSKFLKLKFDCNFESIYVEVNLRKWKWLMNGSYNPNEGFISNHLECLIVLFASSMHTAKHIEIHCF